jgi:hypothetical protein
MKKIISFIIVSFLCAACGTMNINEYGAIDLSKLNNSNEQFGIVLSRTMFFESDVDQDKFIQNDNSLELSATNNVDVNAKDVLGKETGLYYMGYQVGGTWSYSDEDKNKQKLFTLTPKVIYVKSATFKPEYFYTIKMLPAGEYYVSRIIASCNHRGCLQQEYNKDDSPYIFSVKANAVNYIGDVYFSAPHKTGSFFSNKYSLSTELLNKSEKAKAFMQKYHPEINLPFIYSPIRKAH